VGTLSNLQGLVGVSGGSGGSPFASVELGLFGEVALLCLVLGTFGFAVGFAIDFLFIPP